MRGGVSPRVSPFAEVRPLGTLLQRAGFALPVADGERTAVNYREFKTLVNDLRALGEANALARAANCSRCGGDLLAAALAHYAATSGDDRGRLPATFDIVYLTGWAPHESQPKPLKPGSAKTRLADALGAREHGTGEAPDGSPKDQ